jgi:hypothetical protein
VNKANLENLRRGSRPSLHAAVPEWDTLKALVQRAAESLDDSRKDENSLATRFAAAYSASFWLARAALVHGHPARVRKADCQSLVER